LCDEWALVGFDVLAPVAPAGPCGPVAPVSPLGPFNSCVEITAESKLETKIAAISPTMNVFFDIA